MVRMHALRASLRVLCATAAAISLAVLGCDRASPVATSAPDRKAVAPINGQILAGPILDDRGPGGASVAPITGDAQGAGADGVSPVQPGPTLASLAASGLVLPSSDTVTAAGLAFEIVNNGGGGTARFE